MDITVKAIAGTLESSDVMVTVEPNDTLELDLNSSVEKQYGKEIKKCILNVLSEMQIEKGKVTVVDKGALDCTIRARLQAAIARGAEMPVENVSWGGLIK